MSEKEKFGTWIRKGLKANFTGDNIRKINAAFATLIINILASVGLLVVAGAMILGGTNPLITVVLVSIWASVEGFISVAVIALLGSPSKEEDGEITKLFKLAVKEPTEENLLELTNSIKKRIEETFIPEEELPEEDPAKEDVESIPEPEPEPEVIE
jgi:flagellar motor component MotA